MTFCAHKKMPAPHIFVCLQDRHGQRIVTISSLLEHVRLQDAALETVCQLRFHFDFPQLFHGHYSFSVAVVDGSLNEYALLHMVTGISPHVVRQRGDKNTMSLFYLNSIQTSLQELRHA